MEKKADLIAEKIIKELCSRSGFDDWWENIDLDIQDEIKEDLTKIVIENID